MSGPYNHEAFVLKTRAKLIYLLWPVTLLYCLFTFTAYTSLPTILYNVTVWVFNEYIRDGDYVEVLA